MGEITEAVWRKRPPNLMRRKKGDVWYYSYRDPMTRQETGLGTVYTDARQAVQILNTRRTQDQVQLLVNKVEKPAATIAQHAEWFLQVYLPARRKKKTGKPLSAATIAHYDLYLGHAVDGWGPRDFASITRAEAVGLLDRYSPESANKARGHLERFFAQGVARGLREDNPIEGTVKRDTVSLRLRLTRPAYDAIFKASPEWLQRAMTLSLLSLQRPTDLCEIPAASWDGEWWAIRQGKSEAAGFGLLRIRPTAELKAAIEACMKARVADCTFLLCRKPEKKLKSRRRTHWAQLDFEVLNRAFAEARSAVAQNKKTSKAVRELLDPGDEALAPSYYEIKALGARLYEESGRSLQWIQGLMGHQEEATTRIYTDRHKEKWAVVDLAE